jgi:galactose mutarotase-like enzyme
MIVLEGKGVKATFDPEHGLNMVSLIIEGHELIEQSTKEKFLESSRGLGPLIGPHFHHRAPDTIPYLNDEILNRLSKKLRFRNEAEPFSHGIARYVPWKVLEKDGRRFKAVLDSHDEIEGLTLAEIEGFDFKLEFEAEVSEREIRIVYSAKSSSNPVVVGLHTYYALDPTMKTADLAGAPFYYDKLTKMKVPPEWFGDRVLRIPLDRPLDYTFSPKLGRDGFAEVEVRRGALSLFIQAKAYPDLSFQLYRVDNSPFICIEPIAAINPRILTQKNASIEVRISL